MRSSRGSASRAAQASRFPRAPRPARCGGGENARRGTRTPLPRGRGPAERTTAWQKTPRRTPPRRDRKADNYLAFLHLGMILILARSF